MVTNAPTPRRRPAIGFAVALALGTHVGCTHGPGHDHSHGEHDHEHAEASPAEHAEHKHAEHAKHRGGGLRLDDGKKWKANAETTEAVTRMRTLVETALAKPLEAGDATEATGKGLRDAYQQVFTQCTMQGEAHTQLHAFLVPLGALITDVESGEAARAKASLEEALRHLERYARFFE